VGRLLHPPVLPPLLVLLLVLQVPPPAMAMPHLVLLLQVLLLSWRRVHSALPARPPAAAPTQLLSRPRHLQPALPLPPPPLQLPAWQRRLGPPPKLS
jgi:hypothetical protein